MATEIEINNAAMDSDFQEFKITEVRKHEDGYEIHNGAMCCWLSKEYGVVPFEGATVRMWPGGWGSAIRGMMVNGQLAFYRTEAEQKQRNKEQLYGTSSAEMIERWDAGKGIWSIEMGGLGPGYEQALQTAMVELLRMLIDRAPPLDDGKETERDAIWKEIEQASYKHPVIEQLGLSGAQFGAASHLAWRFYRRGPIAIMEDEQVKDRHIQLSRKFPNPYATQPQGGQHGE